MRARRCSALLFVVGLTGCKAFDPQSDPLQGDMFSPCCGDLGTCIARGLVPVELAGRLPVDVCGAALACAPTAYVDDPAHLAPACTALATREGRCLPACVVSAAAGVGRLEQATCQWGELCVPCFNPITGENTGACSVAPDTPHQPAQPFERCCGAGADAAGVCIPDVLLSVEQRGALLPDTCSDPTARCVPLQLLAAAGVLTSCTTGAPSVSPRVCARVCFIGARLSTLLPQGSCGDAERCVPCTDLAVPGGCP